MWKELELMAKTIKPYISYRGRGKMIFSQGNKNAKIMVILNDIKEEALKNEDIFESDEGKKLKQFLLVMNINLDDVYVTSLYKIDKKYINQDSKNTKELLDILITEIMLLNPKYILSFGMEVFNLLVSENLGLELNKNNVNLSNSLANLYKYSDSILIPLYDIENIKKASKEEKNKIMEVIRSIKII